MNNKNYNFVIAADSLYDIPKITFPIKVQLVTILNLFSILQCFLRYLHMYILNI